ncbi:MAG: transglycosylase domain-containing protein [Gammaproteobacteria bacterium]|nr:transglycosylase domain-containing protein [Gammaproteobacteria bacterium]
MQFLFRLGTAVLALVFTAVVLAASMAAAGYYYLEPGLPGADTIREVPLQTPLRIYSRDGRLMAQLGEQWRTPVRFEDIPETVVKAFLAAEDDRFFEHPGFDYQGILRASINFALTGSRTQGGSTITQQLARAYFLSPERSFVRKARELILALRIEREFSKSEILSLYLNKIFLGQRAYGIAAAAEVYFGKDLAQLTLAEAATLAGIPKAPSLLNPVNGPERTVQRRAYVLGRMHHLGFIDQEQYREALDSPLESRLHGPRVELEAPYVTEMVRAQMLERFGAAAYTDGYEVVTTIDSRLQEAANLALSTTLLEYDRRHGYRGPVARGALAGVPAAGAERDRALQALLQNQRREAALYPAVVLSLGSNDSARFFVRDIGELSVPWEGLRWRRYLSDAAMGPLPKGVGEVLAVGDVVHLLRTAKGGWLLAQLPAAEAALVAIDPADGATVALTGGFSFQASKFNRAVQARRQPGSAFKPFVYSAGLEHGFTPATLINDAPLVFGDAELEDVWRPENYSRVFNGPTRMREALVKSLNLCSVRILMDTGIDTAIRHIRGFGFDDTALPRNLSLALGSGGVSPWDMAAGYAAFANGGRHVEHYIIDRVFDAGGTEVFTAEPLRACEACEPPPSTDATAGTSPDGQQAQAFAVDGYEPQVAYAMDGSRVDWPDEVPAYRSVEAMIEHGSQWRPDVGETPAFFRDRRLAPRIIPADNAFLVYDMMRDVIRRGTGQRARELGRSDIAGKTGTSNERRDAWFSGFNGALVATVWVGFDKERSLGPREEGSQTALPMWKDFMARALRGTAERPIPQPPDIISARISPETGQLAGVGDFDAIFEYFRPADLAAAEARASAPEAYPGYPREYRDQAAEIF